MKNRIKITIYIFVLLGLNACDLDRYPETALSDAVYWRTEDDFKQACNYLYTLYVPRANVSEYYFLERDHWSDIAGDDGLNSISDGSYLPSSNFGTWGSDYELIRAANKIIEQAEVADIPSTILSRYIGEAKFFRAYGYNNLVSKYGDVPLILKTLDTDDPELYSPRTARETVVDTIYSDLDYAIENLPAKSEMNLSDDYGRITKGAALAFKSRVGLREGTWVKFHEPSNTTHDYKYHLNLAKQSALELMQSGEYQLYTGSGSESYKDLFKMVNDGPDNPESILARIYGFDRDNQAGMPLNYQAQVLKGQLDPTRKLVDMYLCVDGLPIEKSPLYQGQQDQNSEFVDRDLRLLGTVFQKGDEYTSDFRNLDPDGYIPELTGGTGYIFKKYIDIDGQFIDEMVIRYGEVLLNYAEATFELDNAISDSDLDLSINLLRDRAGVTHLSNSFVTANGLNMRTEIRRERTVELAQEGFRYDDLLRWKIAEEELPKAMLGVRIFAAHYPGVDISSLNMTADSILIVQPAAQRNFDPSKHYLWPLPLTQLALNENLVQNPNW